MRVPPPTDSSSTARGLGARNELAGLRGVRGERLVVRSRELRLQRPVRFLHPRHPIYVVPWGDGLHMVGATVIESDDSGPITVRSALELLGMAYALHPAFGEAEIVEAGAGVRPSFPDNVPKIIVRGRTIHVNGLYRHGFLMAPALAELVADYLDTGAIDNRVFVERRRVALRRVRLRLGRRLRERRQRAAGLVDRNQPWHRRQIGLEAARVIDLRHEARIGERRLVAEAEPGLARRQQRFACCQPCFHPMAIPRIHRRLILRPAEP